MFHSYQMSLGTTGPVALLLLVGTAAPLKTAVAATDPCSLPALGDACKSLDEQLETLNPAAKRRNGGKTKKNGGEGGPIKTPPRGCAVEPVTVPELARLQKAATEASESYTVIANACRDGKCDPTAKRSALLDALVRYARRLAAASTQASNSPDKKETKEKIGQELLRVFSGAAISGNGLIEALQACIKSGTCTLSQMGPALIAAAKAAAATKEAPPNELNEAARAYLDAGGDPAQFSATLSSISKVLSDKGSGPAGLGEIMSLYEALRDPAARRAFVGELNALKASLTEKERKLIESLGEMPSDQQLLQVMLEARRALITLALGQAQSLGYHPGSGNGAKWLQVTFVYGDEPSTGRVTDFEQELKSLLAAITADGLLPPRTTDLCARLATTQARGFLVVRLAPNGDRGIAASGSFYVKDNAFLEGCLENHAPVAKDTQSVNMARGCAQSSGTTASQASCASAQITAARDLLEQFSGKHPIFGRLKYLQGGRSIEQIGPPLHEGVSLSDLYEKAALTAPAVLAKAPGLYIDGACNPEFDASLRNRLQSSYARDVGLFAEVRAPDRIPELRLASDRVGACRASVMVASQQVYGIVASAPPKKMVDAGEDVARVVGQYYRDVRSSLVSPVSRWTALALSGLPYLRDANSSNDRTGWLLTGFDVALLACGFGTGAGAVAARNGYASRTSNDLGTANGLLVASTTCFAALGVERILSALLYEDK